MGGFNIEMILKEISWEGMRWFGLAQESDKWQAVVNLLMKLGVL